MKNIQMILTVPLALAFTYMGLDQASARSLRPGLATPAKLPYSKDRICKKDAQCVFLPSLCPGCHPCKPTWRRVGNLKRLRKIRSMQARIRCAKRKCRRCAHYKNWLGNHAVCFVGQCAVAPLRKRHKKVPRMLKCRRHSDCGFWPVSYCRCQPCGLYWRSVANRAAIRWEMRLRARRGACRRPRCARCHRRALGRKARCVRGQCMAQL